MSAFAEFVLRRRALALLTAVSIMVAACWKIGTLRFESSFSSFFVKDDPVLVTYNRFREMFDSDEYILILADAPEVWSPQYISTVRELGERLKKVPHVLEVTSIANVRHIYGRDQELVVEDLIPVELTDPAEIAARRALALEHPFYKDLLVTHDGRHIAILVRTEISENGALDYKIDLTHQVRTLLDEAPYRGWNIHAAGAPLLDADVQTIVSRESGVFGGIVFLMVGVGLLFMFRSFVGVALPLLIATCSILAAFGVMTWRGSPLGILSPIIPSFMISVGIGSTVYLMHEIYHHMANGSAVRQAIVEAVGSSGAAGVLSVVTTAGGLLAFSSSDIRTVEDIGIATGFGLLIALVLSLLLVPVIFSWSKGGRPSAARDRVLHGRVLYMRHLAEMVISRRRAFLISGAVLGAAAFAGILQLRADYHYLGTFKRDTSIRREYDAVDSVLHASSVIEVLVDTQAVDGLKEPVVLEQLAELQRGVEDDHRDLGIRAYSIVDVLREINQALGGGKKEEYQLPKTRGAIAETLLLFSMSGNNELSKLSSPDYRTARLTFRMPNVPHSSSAAVIASIEQRVHAFDAAIARAGAQPPVVTITGLVKLWHTIHHYLMSSQLNSLAITLVIVTLVMMLVFRSIRLALVLSALNAFAVFITLGIMGWLSVPIEPYTILLSSIALGLLDDDTIHMVTHLLALRKAGVSLIDGIRETFASMGQAMFCMAGVLIAAFALYFFSSIAGLTKFGLLTALTILIGSFVELFLTPPVLLWLEPWLFKTHAAEAPATTAPHAA